MKKLNDTNPFKTDQHIIKTILSNYGLKLNKAISIVAANISIPPMIPFILYGSFEFGSLFMEVPGTLDFSKEITLETVKMHSYQYLTGSFALAFSASLVAGVATFLLLKLFSKKRTSTC